MANIKLGNTRGQSEILYYDYDCNSSGVYSPCEKSYIAVSVAALKMKLGSDNFNYKIAAGYTPINSGTVRSSGGLNPHAFRGFESILTVNDLKLTYAWADEFKNDWSRNFETMTTSSNQNNATGLVDSNGNTIKKGKIIDYIHTAGVVYNFGSTKLDVGYGEGKGYRRNWQALIERNDALPADLFLKTKLFYQGARYIEELSGIKHPSAEYYAGLGFNLTHNNIVWSLGYSQNYSPDTSSYNFRLTPWANSDKRDYQTTLSQLEDYNVSGARALRAGISYNFASFNLPELTLGSAGTYGWHVVSDKNKRGSERQYHGKMYSLDLSARYFFDDGVAKGLSFTLLPALFRARDSNAKTDRNDVKLIVGYKTNIF